MKIQHLTLTQPVTDYHGAPLLSVSSLKAAKMNASEQTLRTGSLFHAAVYEPHEFSRMPEAQAYAERHRGNPAFTPNEADKQMNLVSRMANAALRHPLVKLFKDDPTTVYEQAIYCRLQVAGVKTPVPFRMKADAVRYPAAAQDLKSTAAKNIVEFLEACDQYDYWLQAIAYKLITGVKRFYFVGVSKSEPHRTFTINVGDYPEQMKDAKRRLSAMLKAHVEANPTYIDDAEAWLSKHQ